MIRYLLPELKQKIAIAIIFLITACSVVNAQTGYIYVHTSSVDESSNPTSGTSGFNFTVSGGSTTIPTFNLNDGPASTKINDIGAASTSTLFAATSGGVYYRQVNSATWVLGAGTTGGASKIDGCTNDQAVYISSANGYVYLYDIPTNTSYLLTNSLGSGLLDVAFDRVNNRVIVVKSNNQIVYATLTGTSVGSFSTVSGISNAARIDVDNAGNLLFGGTDGNLHKVANYTTGSPTNTSLGTPASGSVIDVAAADDGSYFFAFGNASLTGVYKYNGTPGNFTLEPQADKPVSITGGPGGQVWYTYGSGSPGTVSMFTRQLGVVNGVVTPDWFDDERVRTTINANSEMLAVAPGTYTITEATNTPNSSWNLQKVTIYDPANVSTSNVTNGTATITVTAGEVVHVIFQNYFAATTTFTNNCATSSYTENFGSGTAGSLASLTTGSMIGATSYHWYGTTTGGLSDGYFGITTQSSDVGYGSGSTNFKDHTSPGTGNYLFVNASYQTDVFYQREFTGLIPGNTYTITYWLLNVTGAAAGGTTTINPINVTAQVTDPVSGNVLTSQTTGKITTVGVWTKETFAFTPGASQTSANFLLVNNAPGGSGNDIGLDDISFVLQPSAAVTATLHNDCNATTSTITITSPLGSAYQYSKDGVTYQTSPIFTGVTQGTSYTLYASYVGSTSCASVGVAKIANTTYTWTGTTSTDPTVGTNWSGGVAPTFDGNLSLNIPVVASGKYPVLTANESIFGLTIAAPGATTPNINLGSYTLNIGCNIVNGGILNSGSDFVNSTINWDGDEANQSYTGNSTAGTAKLGNMTVNNTDAGGAGVITITGGPVDIYNTLNMTEGNLTISSAANTLLTLKSSGTKTAALTAITSPGTGISTPVIKGSVNVERFLTGGAANYRGYRLLSSPVNISSSTSGTGNLGLAYINKTVGSNYGAFTGGPGGSTNGFTWKNPNPTIYLYNEALVTSNQTYISGKNIGITAINSNNTVNLSNGLTNQNIPVGNGYFFYFIGDNSRANPSSGTAPNNTTITATGTLNQGSVPVILWNNTTAGLSYTSGTGETPGFNLVGNPYASTIDLKQIWKENNPSNTTSGISSIFYEVSEPNMNYVSYDVSNGHSSNPTYGGQYIASGQSFMALAQGAGQTLTFNEDQKVTTQLTTSSTPPLLLALKPKELSLTPTPQNPSAGMHLELTNSGGVSTQTGIYFSSAYADVYKQQEDAVDLDGIAPQVYLSSYSTDGKRLGINSMGDYIKGKRVKLYVKGTTTGTYQLGLVDIKNIDTVFNVYLVDKFSKDSVDLQKVKNYSFTITTTDTTSFGANRFVLAIDLKPLPPYKLLSFNGQKESAGAQLTWKTINESNYTGFVLQKQSGSTFISIDSLQSNGSGSYGYLDSQPGKGVNTYRLKQYGTTGNITYSATVNIDFDNSGHILSVYPNPAKGPLNIVVNLPSGSYNLNVYNSMGGLMKRMSLTGSNWTEDISAFATGTYVLEVSDVKGNFVGKTKFVKVQ